jgi:hypothetical protein
LPRLRPPAFALAAVILAAVVMSPAAASAVVIGDCPGGGFDCGGGGGGGGPYTVTSVAVSVPAAAAYSAIPASATVTPNYASGSIQLTVGGVTQSNYVTGGAVSGSFALDASTIGQSVATSAYYTGDGYVYLPSSSTGSPVYVYGSGSVSGTIVLNGQAVPGASVTLIDSANSTIANTTTNGAGTYTVDVNPITAADAQRTYAIRATINGVDYFYNGAGGSTSTFAQATLSGPTQWRPGASLNISGVRAPVWPALTLQTPAAGVPYSIVLGAVSNVPVTYSILSGTLPAGLALNSATGEVSGTATALVNRSVVFSAWNGFGTSNYTVAFRVDGLTAVTLSAPPVAPYLGFDATVTVASAAGTPLGYVQVNSFGARSLVNGSAAYRLYTASSSIGTTATYSTTYTPTAGSGYTASSASSGVYIYGSESVSGTFIQNGVVMAGATIELETTSGVIVDSTTTDATGRYTLGVTTPTTVTEAQATYRIKATTPGGHAVGYYVSGSTQTSATGTTATATLTGPTQWRPGTNTQTFYMITNPVLTDDTLATPRVGSVYADGVSATDPSTIYYAVQAGALPAGLSINLNTGAITGTPTSTAAATFTVRVYTAPWQYGYTDKQFTLTPLRAGIVPAFTDDALGPIVTGALFTDGVTATGDPTITYSVRSGSLPVGIALDPDTGAITGTTSSAAAFTLTVRATNEFGFDDATITGTPLRATTTSVGVPTTASYDDIQVDAVVSSTFGTPAGDVTSSVLGDSYTQSLDSGESRFDVAMLETMVGTTVLTTVDYAGDANYAASSGSGSTYLYGTDTVTGQVTENGEPSSGAIVWVMDGDTGVASGVTDSDGRYSITVDASSVVLATAVYTISATTTNGDTTWFAAGSVGTDPTPSSLEAIASGPTQWRSGTDLDLHLSSAPEWTDVGLVTPRQGSLYDDGVSVDSAGGTLRYEISAGALPAGLALNEVTGEIGGTPTSTTTATFTVRAFTPYGSVTEDYTITPLRPGIVPTFTDETIGDFDVAVPFADAVTASGDPTITYSLSGIVPAGIAIDANSGAISGTPQYAGPFSFTVRAENEFGFVDASFSGWVDAEAVADLTLGFTPGATLGQASLTIAADGVLMGSEYTLTMYSTPRVLFSGTVGSFRSFSQTVSLPADTPVGAHRLELHAIASDGTVLTTTVYFTLLENGRIGAVSYAGPLTFTPAALGRLAATGTDSLVPLALAALLLLGGLVALRRVRSGRVS